MLVLTRKPGENVKIGDDIEVEVIRARGGTVSLGVVAPEEVLLGDAPEPGDGDGCVVARRAGESVLFAGDIDVKVLESRAGLVRLGVDAPRSVRVLRGELVVQVAGENQSAARVGLVDVASLRPVGPAPVQRSRGN